MLYVICKAKNEIASNEEIPKFNSENWEIGTKVKYYWDCMAGRIILTGTITRKYSKDRYEVKTENGWRAINKKDIIETSK